MIKLVIKKVDGYNYILTDKDNKKYMFNIEFYRLENKPKENDYLFAHEEILKEEHSLLSFGPMDGIYGRNIESSDDKDLLVLVVDNKKIYLKRYYG